MPNLHESALPTSSRLLGLLGLAGLVLPTALLAGCMGGDGLDGELESITLRPADFDAPIPSFAVAISLAGEDVALDWSGSQGDAVSVFRSSDPALLASLPLNGALPAGVVEVVLDASATDYADAGAADQDQSTPTYYYRVGIESGGERVLSRLVMKTTTAMAPGYNKFGMCMLEGPTRASDVVARLGSSVVGVWGWDAVNQSYINWTPAQGVGTAADFAIGFGGVFAAQVDGSTPSFQSLVGVVPTNEPFAVTGRPGYNWTTLPVGYDGPATASYWVDQVGYWGMGMWSNLTQNASWYWNSNYADFGLEACQPYYMYLPDNACTSNADCGEDNFCYFVDPAACGDVAAGLCKAQPMGCEFAPVGEVCGCDDVTYASACEAEQAGASVASEGACEVEDPCEGNSCVNGACVGDGGGYACECAPGWTGANCDIEIDECQSNPCVNGDCIDLVNDYECLCLPGFTGTDCEIEIATQCIDTDVGSVVPQTFMGTLVGSTDEYTPTCGAGGGGDLTYLFTAPAAGSYVFDTIGTTEFDTMLAVFDVCGGVEVACHDDIILGVDQDSVIGMELAAGQSVVIVVDSFSVANGAYILNISLDGNDCEPSPCQNGAPCVDGVGTYTCECPPGFVGHDCEIDQTNVCPCLDSASGVYPFIIGQILAAPDSCTTSPETVTGFVADIGGPDTFFVQDDGAGNTVCGSVALTAFGFPSLPVTAQQAQTCTDAIDDAVAAAGLSCAAPDLCAGVVCEPPVTDNGQCYAASSCSAVTGACVVSYPTQNDYCVIPEMIEEGYCDQGFCVSF